MVSLGEILDADGLRNGVSPATDGAVDGDVLTLSAVTGGKFDPNARKRARFAKAVPEAQQVRDGLLLFSRGNGNPDLVGRVVLSDRDLPGVAFPDTVIAGRLDPGRCDPRAICHLWTAPEIRRQVAAVSRTTNGTFKVNQKGLSQVRLPLPPLPEQRRIAAILDKADALRTKRHEAIAHLDTLSNSIFVDMFGDPARNDRSWPKHPLGELATKFSDGPFGSNLKSEHYVEEGIRVVRLQNIGVGHFVDDDAAYVALAHFEKLKKHECRPGDVLIGTLGDPNLRACLLPDSLTVALNKADCVQMRANPKVAIPEFLCALLNQPGTLALANSLILGQTRSRISMGRLRGLAVPVPPIELQNSYAERIQRVEVLRLGLLKSAALGEDLFASLQDRAFEGEL
jgi:type I restriction enzyme, S subunit